MAKSRTVEGKVSSMTFKFFVHSLNGSQCLLKDKQHYKYIENCIKKLCKTVQLFLRKFPVILTLLENNRSATMGGYQSQVRLWYPGYRSAVFEATIYHDFALT